ncbi:putative RNA polymerase sigma factor [Rubrivivax sp. A210]|uniref:RNA polymerase sigma factor n=1 Tax=Rubrivivax sp. A210 TaxID=2772301 RepID=UPI001919966C|nr:sigma-70 family RNA polymerase sigma factor [Rubrivivax sp. A210]CAD5374299.1 putative RNA polymerase sigma factor [Rubrivivax sp. A210]
MTASAPSDDASLVARCRQGDAAAWQTLVKRYQRLVYAIVSRVGLDEHMAADVFQTVFSRLIEHMPRLSQPERLQAWIVTTAKREALRARELARRTVSMTRHDDDGGTDGDAIEDTLADETPLAEQMLSDLQQLDRLRNGLDLLDERCRELLMLVFRDEDERLPYDEVAKILGIPQGSIGPTRGRCLDKLRKLVGSE